MLRQTCFAQPGFSGLHFITQKLVCLYLRWLSSRIILKKILECYQLRPPTRMNVTATGIQVSRARLESLCLRNPDAGSFCCQSFETSHFLLTQTYFALHSLRCIFPTFVLKLFSANRQVPASEKINEGAGGITAFCGFGPAFCMEVIRID